MSSLFFIEIDQLVFSVMALPWAKTTAVFFLVLALAFIKSSTCHVVKGSVSCLDCAHHEDLSDVHVGVHCEKVKQSVVTTTNKDGTFELELTTNPSSTNCQARLLGGAQQLCSYRKTTVSKIVHAHGSNSYTISTPLAFSTSCPSNAKIGTTNPTIGASKTVDIPMPREWGLPPTSFYVPFFPIGIP